MSDNETTKDQLEKLEKEFPLVLRTDAGRAFSTVRGMKAENEMGKGCRLNGFVG